MYIVLELQAAPGNVAHLFETFAERDAAESRFHAVLAAAAVSQVPEHSALLMTSDGQVLRSECYRHGGEKT